MGPPCQRTSLDAERLTEVFKRSRSALYRICADDGGVALLIRRWRTQIARALLAQAAGPPRSDEEIARASDFTGERTLKRALHDLDATTALRLRWAAAEQNCVEVGALLDR